MFDVKDLETVVVLPPDPEDCTDPEDWADFDPGPGPEWSAYLPDGMLADVLGHQCGDGSQWERLERIGAWERVIAWAQAHQMQEMVAFAQLAERDAARHAEVRAAAQAAGEPVAPEVAQISGRESAAAELSLMLRLSPVTATRRLDDALILAERYPATLDALGSGRITLAKARLIAEQTEQLSDEHAAAVEERVLARAGTQTPGQLRRAVRRAVARTDPAAVRRRHQAARRERGVSFWECPDGMAMISACLPAGEAVGVFGVLDEYARATGGPGDDRTQGARRADALVDLVCGPVGYTSTGTRTTDAHRSHRSHRSRRRTRRRRSRVRVQVRVTVPFSTLFGLDDAPGELAGYGPITADQARDLAAEGTWRRILTDPPTGAALDYGTTVYRPPAALRDAVLSRHPICRFPSCLQPAYRGDLDHREPHRPATGTGPTAFINIDPYCRHHHRTKHTHGWAVHHNPDGTLTWTSPTGHTWTHTPPPITDPVPHPPAPTPHDPPPF